MRANKNKKKSPNTNIAQTQAGPMLKVLPLDEDSDNPIVKITGIMGSVDTTSPIAKLNATSIEDNNGGRINLNKDHYIKK